MKYTCCLFILFFAFSCSSSESSEQTQDNSKETAQPGNQAKENPAPKNSPENKPSPKGVAIDISSFDQLFEVLSKPETSFEANAFPDKIPYPQLDDAQRAVLAPMASEDLEGPFYAIGKTAISKRYTAYLLGSEHLYGWLEVHLGVYDTEQKAFTQSFEAIAYQDGDAGETLFHKSWLQDIDKDGIPELIQRTGSTFLEIDAEEDQRETNIDDAQLWKFNTESGAYGLDSQNAAVKDLNQRFPLGLEEML